MQEAKAPSFFKYFDYSTGKMKKDAPQSAKDAYKKWQSEPNGNPVGSKPKKAVRKTTKKK